MPDFTIGVEEEFFLIDAETRELRPASAAVLAAAPARDDDQLEPELHRSQVESGTAVCTGLDEVRAELRRLRSTLAAGAAETGSRLLASGTHPLAHWADDPGVTPKTAYRRLERDYRQLTREQLICGCHIHVCVSDRELAIQVMNRARSWLPLLVALGGNSPYWLGEDTDYSSYRTEVFRRWPTAGVPEHFASRQAYDALVQDMIDTRAIDQPARLYWDLRPSARYDTLEFRATDVLATVDEAVTIAGIARALVETCHRDAVAGRPEQQPRPELLRAAMWRAARHGLTDQLIDVQGRTTRDAADLVQDLLQLIEPVLVERGEWAEVVSTCQRLVQEGNGAERQRRAFERRGSLEDVVDMLVAATSA
jgi:carboxylate-amine ligase